MRNQYPTVEIAAGIARLVDHVNAVKLENHNAHGFKHCHPETVEVDPNGQKFARVHTIEQSVRTNERQIGSVYCFVALEAGENKKLGKWQEGDIFKPDGWKGPAKHARGNVYTDLSKCGVWGPEYLK